MISVPGGNKRLRGKCSLAWPSTPHSARTTPSKTPSFPTRHLKPEWRRNTRVEWSSSRYTNANPFLSFPINSHVRHLGKRPPNQRLPMVQYRLRSESSCEPTPERASIKPRRSVKFRTSDQDLDTFLSGWAS